MGGQDKRKIMTTRTAGGLLLGYNPRDPGQGLKSLAFTSFRPNGPLTRGGPVEPAVPAYLLNGSSYSLTLSLSRAMSARSCSRMYFAIVASFNPTVDT